MKKIKLLIATLVIITIATQIHAQFTNPIPWGSNPLTTWIPSPLTIKPIPSHITCGLVPSFAHNSRFPIQINFEVDPDDPKINKPNILAPVGLSVNSYSGNLFYQRSDLEIPGIGLPIDLTFSYNNANTSLNIGYGPGWSMTYSLQCIPNPISAIIRNPDGRKDIYTKNGNVFTAPAGIFDSLTEYQSGKYKLRAKHGIQYFFDDTTHHGVTSMVDANGNTTTITYTGLVPTTITDASGRSVSLTYTNGHLTQITDANTSTARTITYQYDAFGNPTAITDPLGNTIQYEYDVVHNMTKVIDQANNPFTISYLNCATVQTITSPLNNISFNFNTSLLTTTDSMNVNGFVQSNSYKYDTLGNMIELVEHNNANSAITKYEYDTLKNMTKIIDAEGYEYHYQYDARGNQTQEINPLGGIKISNYESVFNKEIYFKDANNNITTYDYDINGNKTQTNKPLSVTENYTYDIYGNMITKVDGEGYSSHFTYNNSGETISDSFSFSTVIQRTFDNVGNCLNLTDANGHTTTKVYDKLNRQTQTTDALGNITLYAYDSRSNLISVTDPLGHITTYQYDALNRKTQMTTLAGTSSYIYDEHGNLKTHTDNKGNVTQYAYDKRNRLVSQTNAMGAIRTMAYDKNNNKIDEYDYNGNHIIYQYDSLNRLTNTSNALSQITEYGYDANGNRTSIKDANNHTTNFVFDALNRMTELHKPIGVIYFEYDKNSKNTKIIDANNHAATFVYDSLNRLKTIIDALAHSLQYVYDKNNNLISSTDRNGNTTTYQYDFLNRKIKTTNAVGEKDSLAYNGVGKIIYQKTQNDAFILYVYDGVHRLIGLTDSLGTIETYRYDPNSNLTSVKNANGDSTRYTYDSLNRLKSTIDASGNSITNSYDANSNLISIQDRNGNTTAHAYDADNRKISSTSALGFVTTMTYDAVDNLLTSTDPELHTTTFAYDVNNRMTNETRSDGSFKTFTYDAKGNVLTRGLDGGVTITNVYDVLDRLILRNYPGTNDDVFTYDFEGNVLTANNSNATITNTYDNVNRKLSETLNGKTISYTYNLPERKKIYVHGAGAGRTIINKYDVRMRPVSIVDSLSTITYASFGFDGANHLENRAYDNGVVTNFTYNSNDWVTSVNHIGGSNFAQFNYAFDDEGQILTEEKLHHATHSEKYTYTFEDQLSNFRQGTLNGGNIPNPLTQSQFNYDSVENWTSVVKTTPNIPLANTYVFTQSVGATLDPMTGVGVTQILNPNNDDIPTPVINIGFPFFYEGISYTTFSMSPDGFVKLGTVATQEPNNLVAHTLNRPKLMPMWDNLATGTTGNGKMKVTGVVGNRILMLQWFVTIPRNIAGAANSTFQIWLYEANGVIEYRYGIGNATTGGATIGINSVAANPGNFISVTASSNTASTSAPNNNNNTWPGNSKKYTFTPNFYVTSTKNYTANVVNKYTTINTTNPTYDAYGNTTNDAVHSYQYDTENKLISVDNGATATYKSDAIGRRIQKITSTETINYFYDGNHVIEERNAADNVVATYIYGENNEILSMNRGGIDYFYHTNSNGSVIAVTDNTGVVVERYEYDAFGYPTMYDASFVLRATTAIGNTHLLIGKEFDKETGLYHSDTRTYNPQWGRFMQWNPNEMATKNLYTHAMNNPVNVIDIMGYQRDRPYRPRFDPRWFAGMKLKDANNLLIQLCQYDRGQEYQEDEEIRRMLRSGIVYNRRPPRKPQPPRKDPIVQVWRKLSEGQKDAAVAAGITGVVTALEGGPHAAAFATGVGIGEFIKAGDATLGGKKTTVKKVLEQMGGEIYEGGVSGLAETVWDYWTNW